MRRIVPEAGIEPALLAEHEFESCASTSSATQAGVLANGGQKYPITYKIATWRFIFDTHRRCLNTIKSKMNLT